MDNKIQYHVCRKCLANIPYIGVRPVSCQFCLTMQTASAAVAQGNSPPIRRPSSEPDYEEEEESQVRDYDIERLSRAVRINVNGPEHFSWKDVAGGQAGMPSDNVKRKSMTQKDYKALKKKLQSDERIYIDPDKK